MMKMLVLGAGGQVGRALLREAPMRGLDVVGLDRAALDIADSEALETAVGAVRPDVVVNCASWNAVDLAEDKPDTAFLVNGSAPGHLAMLLHRSGIRLVHYSTDYVFDGASGRPYTEVDLPAPISVYGRSKLAGEQAVLAEHPDAHVLRTSMVYSAEGHNFVTRLFSRIESAGELRFICDTLCTPTLAADLAAATIELVCRELPPGLYHAAGSDAVSPFDWARLALASVGRDEVHVLPVKANEFPSRAPRPKCSALLNTRLEAAGVRIPGVNERLRHSAGSWKPALAQGLK